MIRLLIVLAIIALAVVFINTGTHDAKPQKPEEQYIEQTGKAQALEQQMQEQAAQQLKDIDEKSK